MHHDSSQLLSLDIFMTTMMMMTMMTVMMMMMMVMAAMVMMMINFMIVKMINDHTDTEGLRILTIRQSSIIMNAMIVTLRIIYF